MNPHYISLVAGYSLVVALWFTLNHFFPTLWRHQDKVSFNRPHLEFVYAIIAVIAIIGIGQLYSRDLLIPADGNVFLDAINQLIIFSPTLVLILLRKQSVETLWLPKSKVALRILVGFLLALCSVTVYWLTRSEASGLGKILSNIYHYQNISYLVQVFMEDITIALIFVRLSAWIGTKWSIVLVAVLFSAGHIPAFLTNGASLIDLSSLILDTFLGVLVLTAVAKSRDVWWFFMVHFAMDMTQFYGSPL